MLQTWPSGLPQTPTNNSDTEQQNGLFSPDYQLDQQRYRTYPDFLATYKFIFTDICLFHVFRKWWDEELNQCGSFTAPWLPVAGFCNHYCTFDFDAPWNLTVNGDAYELDLSLTISTLVPVDSETGATLYGKKEVI